MSSTHKILLAVVFLSAGLAAAGCRAESRARRGEGSAASPADPTAPAAAPPVAVQTFEVQPTNVAAELSVPASVSVEGTALVIAQREGVVTRLDAQEGGRVSKGQTLAVLSNDDQLTELRRAELDVSRLKVEEQQYESLVKVSRNELEREQALFRDGVSSQRDLERAQFRLDGALSELEKTRIATRTAQAKVEAVRYEIEKGTVRAPIAGLVTRRHVNVGTGVTKNEKLFEVSPLAPLQVRFQLPQTERGRLGPGSLVALFLPDSDRAVAQARVRRLDPVADAASNTFGYLADVVGGAGLIPGTAVNVRVPRPGARQTFWVPRAAFPAGALEQAAGATATLLVVEGERCAARAVTLGASDGEQIEITAGLAAGERVILAPPANLKTGDVVEAN